jgi:serine protease Do
VALAADANPTVTRTDTSGPDLYRDLQGRFRTVAEKLKPSLVRIETVGGAQPLEDSRLAARSGGAPGGPYPAKRTQNPFRDAPGGGGFVVADGPTTGIIYSADGLILTSSFNFVTQPAIITVTLADGRHVAADLIARDQVRKIALLKVDATGLMVPQWAPLDDLKIGEWAVALGLGLGADEPSITVGIVSALNRMHSMAVQTDARLSPVNYGGPLCDLDGRIIGLCVPMAQRPGELAGIEFYDSGIGFAVPRVRLEPIVEELKTGRSFYRGWLGVVFDPRRPDSLVIQKIASPSPAANAGLEVGDRLVEINGKKLRHYGQLVQSIYMIPAGEPIILRVERDNIDVEIKLPLARNNELGPLPEVEEPLDPAQQNPEPQPKPNPDEPPEGDE